MPLDYTSQAGEKFPGIRHSNSGDLSEVFQPAESIAGPDGTTAQVDTNGLFVSVRHLVDALLLNGDTTGIQNVISVLLAKPGPGGPQVTGTNANPFIVEPAESAQTQEVISLPGLLLVSQSVAGAPTNPWHITPRTPGGLSMAHETLKAIKTTLAGHNNFLSIDLDESEEEVSAIPITVQKIHFTNTSTVTCWLKLYNATAANVTVGTTTPVYVVALPGTASGDDVSGALDLGMTFSTACCAAATTGVAHTDVGAPGNNHVIVNILYDPLI